MSQRSEKYARRIERRVDRLEEAVDSVKTEQTAQGARIAGIEDDLAVYRAAKAEHSRKAMREKARREQQELERRRARAETALRVGICVVLAAFAMAAALVMAAGAEDACAFVEKTDAADLLGVYALQAEQAPDAMEQERYKGYSEQNGAPARAQRKRVLWGEEKRRNGRFFPGEGNERYEGRFDEGSGPRGHRAMDDIQRRTRAARIPYRSPARRGERSGVTRPPDGQPPPPGGFIKKRGG